MTFSSRAIGLDIGSNTFSCVEIELLADDSVTVIRDTSRSVRLSANLIQGKRLDRAAISRGLNALKDLYCEFNMDKHPLRVVGTQVLRMTSAPEDFTEKAQDILGVTIEILTGEEEALLGGQGGILGLPEQDSWIVIDVGGQSTEICAKTEHGDIYPISIPLGVLGLTEKFIHTDPPGFDQMQALNDHVSRQIRNTVPQYLKGDVIGVAGTATTLGLLELGLTKWHREKVHGITVERKRLDSLLDELSSLTVTDRIKRFGISEKRADIFPAGICILQTVLQNLGRERMIVSANGLRVGAALSLLQKQ